MAKKRFTRMLSGMMALILVLSLCPVSVFATELDPEIPAETLNVTVQVLNGDQAVAGAAVSIQELDVQATTDENGAAVFEALTVGETYTVAVSCEGYANLTQEFICGEENVMVSLEKSMHDVTLQVTDKNSNAIAGASVTMDGNVLGTTGEEGTIVLKGLIYGETYTIDVSCEGYAPNSCEVVCNGAESASVQLFALVNITGTVTCADDEDAVVTDATLTLNFQDKSQKFIKTNEEGKFTFENVCLENVTSLVVSGTPYQEVTLEEVFETNEISISKKVFAIRVEANDYSVGQIETSAETVKYGESASITISTVDGNVTHSIFAIIDNGNDVTGSASGETSDTYTIENVTENHTVRAVFSEDTEVITFWMDDNGKLYVEKKDSEELTEAYSWNFVGLNIKKETVTNEVGEVVDEYLHLTYNPTRNYRVISVVVDDDAENAYISEENSKGYEEEIRDLEPEQKHKYVIKVQANQFYIDITTNDESAVITCAEKVFYNHNATLNITAPEGKYLSALLVQGEDVLDYSKDSEAPISYTLDKIREDKKVYVEFADMEAAAEDAISITTEGNVYSDGYTYYLPSNSEITIEASENKVKIARDQNGPFVSEFVLNSDDLINGLYLLDGNVITKWEQTVQTIVDTTAPEIKGLESFTKVNADNKVSVLTWAVSAADNENGSGINRVVYSTSKTADPRKLETVANANFDGTYSCNFQNDCNTYYFWVIDNVGNVSAISNPCEVDSDIGAPVITDFKAEGFYSFTSPVDGMVKYYPMAKEDCVTFTVSVSDSLNDINSVTLKIGEEQWAMTSEKGTDYSVTVSPAMYNYLVESDENEALDVTVIAVDTSENRNESTALLEQQLIFEEKLPTAEAEIDAPVVNGEVNWYKDQVTFTVTLEDSGSGLDKDSIVILNDYNRLEDYDVEFLNELGNPATENQKISKAVLTITAQGNENALTEFAYQFTVSDNEGNILSYAPDSLKFTIDNCMPVLEKFDLVSSDPAYTYESLSGVTVTDYGYFFQSAATVKVYFSDNGSQVQTIHFYTNEHDSEEKTNEQSMAANYDKESKRWYAEFEVPEGFKGQIYAYAIDNVENKSVDAYPENLTITESQDTHNKTCHVALTLPETELTDKAGTPLYTLIQKDEEGNIVEVENPNIPVTVVVNDTFNGIKTVTYAIKVPGMKDKVLSFDVTNDKDVTIVTPEEGKPYFVDSNDVIWTINSMDQNLITEITADIPVTDNRNDIEVTVEMTDCANNISTNLSKYGEAEPQPVKLSIDNDAPVIEIAHIAEKKAETNENTTNEDGTEVEVPEIKDNGTEGKGMNSLGSSPYFVGFNPNELTTSYDIYSKSTLQFKITERNFIKANMSDAEAEAQLETMMEISAEKIMINKNLVEDADGKEIAQNLTGKLKYFGPFYDATVLNEENKSETVRLDAQYPYVDEQGNYYGDSIYYLVELRDCYEDESSGTYETSLKVTDLLNFSADVEENFVIDDIAPKITIYFDNNDVKNEKYYKANRTAVITVVERNFNNKNGTINGTATLDGKEIKFPTLGTWNDSKDHITHTAIVHFTNDGYYQNFTAIYKDLAGRESNLAVANFHVDKTLPVINISGVLDKSANNETVAPEITYTDINIDLESIEIVLTGANNGAVDYKSLKEAITHGEKVLYDDFEYSKDVDDIYTLFVKALDLAGNEITDTIRFSCNRFGSVFDLSNIKDMLNKYNQQERDIVITETNVDELDMAAVRITLTKNGVPTDLTMGRDFNVDVIGDEGTWHQYTYSVNSELFQDDGTYSLYFYTEDVAGNINENIDEAKDAQIAFGIDKTKPIATAVDFESETQYAMESKTVSIEIKDNLLLEGVKVYLNNEEITFVVDGDNYVFDIPMSNSKQTVRIVAVDAAGNEEELLVKDFLVTTNLFVRWYNNTPLFIGSVVVMSLVLIALTWYILFVIKKKNKVEEVI